ncbi:MAG: ATP-binding cassette domain-containing protein, partial [Calditrichaceae bacterium]
SGIGKSIISKAVYGLLDPDDLEITIDGQPYGEYIRNDFTRKVQDTGFFVFQEPSSHLNPLLKLNVQLNEGSINDEADETEILKYLWDTTDDQSIKKILDIYPKPYRPSGGEKQRILLAMAFKKINLFLKSGSDEKQALFVFDEPTGSLDNHFRNLFLNLLFEKYRQKPFTALIITHDYSIISEIFKKHEMLLDSITFRELDIMENRLLLREFVPADYLDWLKSAAPAVVSGIKETPHLRMRSAFRVFGRNLKVYKDPDHTEQADLGIKSGEMVYVKAPSGVGKTTLAKVIMGLIPAEYLSLRIGEHEITSDTPPDYWKKYIWGKQAGMVFQHADEALNLNTTVGDIFKGLPNYDQIGPEKIRRQLSDLFDMEIDEAFLKKTVKFLSGGQKQRLNLLRTIILNTDLLILDEPLNGLDFASSQKIITMIQEKQQAGKGILLISHNEEILDPLVPAEKRYYLAASSTNK